MLSITFVYDSLQLVKTCTVLNPVADFNLLLAYFLNYDLKVTFHDLGCSLLNNFRVELVNSFTFGLVSSKVCVELLIQLFGHKRNQLDVAQFTLVDA